MMESLNGQKLQRCLALPWSHLGEDKEVWPEWKSRYKSPLSKSVFLTQKTTKCSKKVVEIFSFKVLIFGFKYIQAQKNKCQIMNFILSQSKMVVYVSRKMKVVDSVDSDVVLLLSTMMKAWVLT